MEPQNILFLSSAFKGEAMLIEAKHLGFRVMLITDESLKDEPWPRSHIDEILYVPDFRRYQDVINGVTYLARDRRIARVIALDEFEVELAAILREHLRLPGWRVSAVRHFRDKLTMRELTHAAGIPVPPFIGIKHYDDLRDYMARVSPPWVLKPRSEAGSMGLSKPTDSEQVWRALDDLGDRQSYYLLEQFIPGDVYHVDSLVQDGRILFSSIQKYGAPPMEVYQGGGVFNTRILDRNSDEAQALAVVNARVLTTLGMQSGVAHAEYIRSHADGTYYFLEVAVRVGGAFIADMIEQATGVNLWREWMRMEAAQLRGEPYHLPTVRTDYGGLLVTLAKQQNPDLSAYDAPEVVWRANKPYHAVLALVSPDAARVESLLAEYTNRFVQDFTTRHAPQQATRTGRTG